MKPARHVRLSKKRQMSRNAKGKSTFGDLPVGARFALAGRPDEVWTKRDKKTAVCGTRIMDAMDSGSGVSLRASQSPLTTVRFSFGTDTDRDDFQAEVEFAFRKTPLRAMVYNATYEARMSNAEDIKRVERIATKYAGIEMSLVKPLSFDAKDPGGVLKIFKKALGYLRAGPRSLESLVEPSGFDEQTLLNALNAAVRMKLGIARGGPNENPIFRVTDIDKAVAAVKDVAMSQSAVLADSNPFGLWSSGSFKVYEFADEGDAGSFVAACKKLGVKALPKQGEDGSWYVKTFDKMQDKLADKHSAVNLSHDVSLSVSSFKVGDKVKLKHLMGLSSRKKHNGKTAKVIKTGFDVMDVETEDGFELRVDEEEVVALSHRPSRAARYALAFSEGDWEVVIKLVDAKTAELVRRALEKFTPQVEASGSNVGVSGLSKAKALSIAKKIDKGAQPVSGATSLSHRPSRAARYALAFSQGALKSQKLELKLAEPTDPEGQVGKLEKFMGKTLKVGRNVIKGYPVDIPDQSPDAGLKMTAVDRDACTELLKLLRAAGFSASRKGDLTIFLA